MSAKTGFLLKLLPLVGILAAAPAVAADLRKPLEIVVEAPTVKLYEITLDGLPDESEWRFRWQGPSSWKDEKVELQTLIAESQLKDKRLPATIVSKGDGVFYLEIRAANRCRTFKAKTNLVLEPLLGQQLEIPRIVWPLTIRVEGNELLCRLQVLIPASVLLLAGGCVLLTVFAWRRRSNFIQPELLAQALRPQQWNDMREPSDLQSRGITDPIESVQTMVEKGLSPWRRRITWLRSWPWLLVLRGRYYEEAVRLNLRADKGWRDSRVELISNNRFRAYRYRRKVEPGGCLLAVAERSGKLEFYLCPDSRRRVAGYYVEEVTPGTPRRIQASSRLKPNSNSTNRDPGGFAGWKVG